MRDFETWMWSEACDMLDKADRLHRQFFRPTIMNTHCPTWEPPVDVYETHYEFIITIALPGVAPEQVNISLENSYLVIEGRRHLPVSESSEIRRLEIPYGQFERRIQLPQGRFEIGKCKWVYGCLLIKLRKL